MTSREFDAIIFGATGYTGRYVVEEIARTSKSGKIKWAVAGRNVNKIKESLDIVQEYLGDEIDIRNTTIIQADVGDALSLSDMCKKARVIVNVVGPYKLYGEGVVQACVENGTHHVDISGEMHFLDLTQANYFKAAREKGAYIVGACGFDSIPADYGVSLLKKNFPGDLNSVEYFVHIAGGPSGIKLNIGTLLSVVHSAGDHLNTSKFDIALKKEVFKKDLIKSNYPLRKRFPPLFYNREMQCWCLWFMGPDIRVLERSEKFRYEYLNEKPIQTNGYIQMPSFCSALGMMFLLGVIGFFSLFSCGRNLISRYPSFFTAGLFSSEGPTREQVMETSTTVTLVGKGWKNKLSEPTDEHTTEPDTVMKLTIKGGEPAYSLTSRCLVHAALTIIEETDKLPLEGGVLTPGVAFENTNLINRLEKSGVTFKFENIS